jgi:ubiquitin-conjugating enzyme E2 J1
MPAWGIRTVLIALVGFFPSPAQGIGAIEYPDSTRKQLAKKSLDYKCTTCGCDNRTALPPQTTTTSTTTTTEEHNHVHTEEKQTEQQRSQTETKDVNSSEVSPVQNEIVTEEPKPTTELQDQAPRKSSNTSTTRRVSNVTRRKMSTVSNTTATVSRFEPGAFILNLFIFIIAVMIGYIMYNKAKGSLHSHL